MTLLSSNSYCPFLCDAVLNTCCTFSHRWHHSVVCKRNSFHKFCKVHKDPFIRAVVVLPSVMGVNVHICFCWETEHFSRMCKFVIYYVDEWYLYVIPFSFLKFTEGQKHKFKLLNHLWVLESKSMVSLNGAYYKWKKKLEKKYIHGKFKLRKRVIK